MAYSIQYEKTVKRKRKHAFRRFWAVVLLVLAILGRIFAQSYLEAVQSIFLGEARAVAAFYEDFVKHEP